MGIVHCSQHPTGSLCDSWTTPRWSRSGYILEAEEAGPICNENLLRVGHGTRAEQSAIPIRPRSAEARLELNLIIVIRSQVCGIHPHHRQYRWPYGGDGRRRNVNRWRVRVADASTGDGDVGHHTTRDLRNRRGIGAATANYGNWWPGGVAGTA